jgi:predicted exporter
VVFGTLMGVPSGLVCAVLLPLTFARPQWRRGYRIVIPSFLALLGLQFLAMYLS